MADARGPDAVAAKILEAGVAVDESVQGRDAILLSIPFGVAGTLADLFVNVPAETVVIDTSNHYPHRNGRIEAVGDGGKVENMYTSELLGRPIVKAGTPRRPRPSAPVVALRASGPHRHPGGRRLRGGEEGGHEPGRRHRL
ncbi:hypothetical protein ACFZCU_12835 [Streptomyces canus]|uniref:hypothetical protein n=1 Tax=Streptomyces canus TaxID=58343 RepID=UPI0036E0E28A